MKSHLPIDSEVVQQFKSSLENQQRELQHMIRTAENEIRALADSGPLDAVDLSSGSFFKELTFARNTQVVRQLRHVELALKRIHNDQFGTCDVCEGVIGLKRLQAIPWARHCIECQEKFEQLQRPAKQAEKC
jgi:DnaK suppressor protein